MPIENIDYVTINGQQFTPEQVVGSIAALRTRTFDLEMAVYPVVRESDRVIHPEKLTETQKEELNNTMYNLSRGQVGDSRFHTEFQYYAALLRGAEDNADRVARLKRRIYATYAEVHSIYGRVYNFCLMEYGKATMGNNDTERKAWFQQEYPALYRIHELYDAFLEEVDIELERWKDFSKAASRMLSATELDYMASGKLYTNKRGEYLI